LPTNNFIIYKGKCNSVEKNRLTRKRNPKKTRSTKNMRTMYFQMCLQKMMNYIITVTLKNSENKL